MNFNIIYKQLLAMGNQEKALKMEAYQRYQFSFLGVFAPERRAVQQSFFNAEITSEVDWVFVEKCWECPKRELQYTACDYLKKQQKHLTANDLHRFKKLITQKSWWDSVDTLSPIIGKLTLNFPELNAILLEWSVTENIWLRRVAIIHQLFRKEKMNTELLSQIIKNNLGQREFFINKAIGWALRDYAKTNRQWVRVFLENYRYKMAKLSIREASKYL